MLKRFLSFFVIFFALESTLSSQILFYGVVPQAHVEKASNEYNALENGLLDAGYEIGLIGFDIRDSNEFTLENALYAARSLATKYVLVWNVLAPGRVSLKAYTTDGNLLAEADASPAELGDKKDKTKSLGDLYFKFARDFVMELQGKLK